LKTANPAFDRTRHNGLRSPRGAGHPPRGV